MMDSITDDEIELEEIDSDEIGDDVEDGNDMEESAIMLCTLCKVNIPRSQTVDHLRKDHQIQRFSALESLLNLGIIMKAKNVNSNNIERKTNSMKHTSSVATKRRNTIIYDAKDGSNVSSKRLSHNIDTRSNNSVKIKSSDASLTSHKRTKMTNPNDESQNTNVPNLRSMSQIPNITFPSNATLSSKTSSKQVLTSASYETESTQEKTHNKFLKLDELSVKDANICDKLRILPEIFIAVRTTMVKECQKRNGIKASDIRKLLKMDVNKTTKLYYHFLQENLIYKSAVNDSSIKRIGNLKLDLTKALNLGDIKSNDITSISANSSENNLESVTTTKPMIRAIENHQRVLYSSGELILSHMKGYPWWPSLIIPCPFLNVPHENNNYFVLFLDGKKNDTAWLDAGDVKKFHEYGEYLKTKKKGTRPALLARMRKANKCAQEIKNWTNTQRLKYFVEENNSAEDLCHSLMLSSKTSEVQYQSQEFNVVASSSTEGYTSSVTDIIPKLGHWKKRKGLAKKSLRNKRKITKRLTKDRKDQDITKSTKPLPISLPLPVQSDKDSISFEEDNDIVSIVNELVNELYS